MLRSGSTVQDRYHILEEIGRGGMAVVYKAYQPALERYVAIKALPQELTYDREFVERFLREARAAAKLNHPNIVTIHDVGQADSTYFIVMEYVDGRSLADLLKHSAPLPQQRVVQIISHMASALDYAHRHGFVHRDIKPGNVLLDAQGVAKLTDFGIVKAAEGTRLTQTGTLLGTPAYMSPEQARGLEVGHLTDVYSLGVIAYELLSGRVPFSGETMAVLHAHAYEAPDLQPLPPRARGVLQKALAKRPEQRFPSAGAFAQGLIKAVTGVSAGSGTAESVTRPHSLRSLPGVGWAVGAAALILVVVGLVALVVGKGEAAHQTPTQATTTPPVVVASPSRPKPASAPGTIQYTVQEGDTITSIANRFQTTVDEIMSASDLDSDVIYDGQVLTILPFTAATRTPL
ncbi:MAG: protein kinase domain-containing protein [Anaerolineae bacterium]